MIHRLRAGLIHLSISAVWGLIAVGVVFLLWYPHPLQTATGVTDVFLIVLGVDVIIGPLLTTLVYRPGKKSLRFDLSTIALLQMLAFGYGIWTVAQGRPAWLVYNADRFDLVQAYQIDQRKAGEASAEYRSASWLGPRWVSARLPDNPEERKAITLEAMFAGVDIAQRPELYRSLDEDAKAMRERAKPLEELIRYNSPSTVDEARQRWPEADAYLPMMARAHPVTVLLNKASAKVVAIVDLNPWE